MNGGLHAKSHSAEGAALGFYYQAFFALLTLLTQNTDNAAVGIEQLDDVELKVDGHTLLYQLKHSISAAPPAISLKSKSFWRTVKVWVDILPSLTLSETTLHLVAVGIIPSKNPLNVLLTPNADRTDLIEAMYEEAHRIVKARDAAAKLNKQLPYADRIDGCMAFLSLSEIDRLNLMRRATIRQESPRIDEIESRIADSANLKILPAKQRAIVASRLVEWWDRQVVYSLCNQRDRIISRTELQHQISAIVTDIGQGKLIAEFETISPPDDYQPDGMLARQIRLVEGKQSDHSRAIREEWRARQQRSKWINENPAMAATINDYDRVLFEYWSDHHAQMVEDCSELADKEKCERGLKLLRWTHDEAPREVRPIAERWDAAYYARGSYQVLSISLMVGWHPEYDSLLGADE